MTKPYGALFNDIEKAKTHNETGKNEWQKFMANKKAIFQDGLFINEHEYPDILICAYFVVLLQPDFPSNT